MTNGNSNCFSDPIDSPFALQLPAIRAVQGDCERVYSGQPWEVALDPCLIYDTDRYGWIWGSLCACATARRHCRRLQPIAIGYSRPSSCLRDLTRVYKATKISDYGCSGLDRANTWTNSVLICDLWICQEMRYSLYVRRNARFFHLYENLKLQDRLISLTLYYLDKMAIIQDTRSYSLR